MTYLRYFYISTAYINNYLKYATLASVGKIWVNSRTCKTNNYFFFLSGGGGFLNSKPPFWSLRVMPTRLQAFGNNNYLFISYDDVINPSIGFETNLFNSLKKQVKACV